MKSIFSVLIVLLLNCSMVVVYCQQSGNCPTSCSNNNCQLNNVESLRYLVQSVVNETLNETFQSFQRAVNASIQESIAQIRSASDPDAPVIKMLYITRGSSTVELRNVSGSSIGYDSNQLLARLSSFNPSSSTSSNNILAYRPNYSDSHTSGLGAIFVNIETIFSCVGGSPEYYPVCKVFTWDEDGFLNGRTILEIADCGNHITIFTGTNQATFGFAFSGCPTITTDCLPVSTDFTIVCLLPRSRCG